MPDPTLGCALFGCQALFKGECGPVMPIAPQRVPVTQAAPAAWRRPQARATHGCRPRPAGGVAGQQHWPERDQAAVLAAPVGAVPISAVARSNDSTPSSTALKRRVSTSSR